MILKYDHWNCDQCWILNRNCMLEIFSDSEVIQYVRNLQFCVGSYSEHNCNQVYRTFEIQHSMQMGNLLATSTLAAVSMQWFAWKCSFRKCAKLDIIVLYESRLNTIPSAISMSHCGSNVYTNCTFAWRNFRGKAYPHRAADQLLAYVRRSCR